MWPRFASRAGRELSLLCLTGGVSATVALGASSQDTQPKVVWEKTFEETITAVGIDQECIRRGRSLGDCLKWILLETEKVKWVREGEVFSQVPDGHLNTGCISPSGNHFSLWERVGERDEQKFRHLIYDWDGGNLWEMEHPWGKVHLRDDGSSVFPHIVYPGNSSGYALGLEFYDEAGNLVNDVGLPRLELPLGRITDINDSFFTIVTYGSGNDLDARVFDKMGQVVWQRDALLGENYKSVMRDVAVTVSNRGELLLCANAGGGRGKVLIYDQSGEHRDNVPLDNTGRLGALEAFGRLAFGSTRRGWGPGVFFCYDLDSMRCRFRIEANEGEGFGKCDVNLHEKLVAVAAHDISPGEKYVKIYDLDGNYRTEIEVDTEIWRLSHFWFGLVGRNVLIAEKHRLKLIETGER